MVWTGFSRTCTVTAVRLSVRVQSLFSANIEFRVRDRATFPMAAKDVQYGVANGTNLYMVMRSAFASMNFYAVLQKLQDVKCMPLISGVAMKATLGVFCA